MKKFLCLFLSLSILVGMFSGINVFAYTEEDYSAVYAENGKTQEEEYIYYTDLFYAYPMYLSEDKYFETYSNNIENVYDTVHCAYQNSSLIVGTGLDHALDTITSPTDMVKLITDTLGLTDFSYNDALDAANNEFVRNILSESTVYSVEKAFGKTADINNKLNKIVGYFNKLELENANGNIAYSAEYYVQEAFDYLHDKGVFSFVSEQTLAKLWMEINNSDFALSDYFTLAKNEIDIAKALVTAILLEDVRLVMVDQIIATQKSDTILKQGMVRLKNQLYGNFIDYFIKNYLVDKLADKVFEEIDKIVVDVVTGKELSAIIKVAKTAFDFIVDVPSYGDVLKWQVLICYSNDLANVIPQVADTFAQGPFLSDRILEYESMFAAYDAINKAAMASTKIIAEMLDPFGAAYEVLAEALNDGIETVTIKSGLVTVAIPATTSSSELYAIMLGDKILTTSAGGIFTIGKKIEVSNGKTTVTVPIQANILSSVMHGCISESQQVIDNFNASYGEISVYGEHIKNVKQVIISTPVEDRKIIDKSVYSNWTYSLNGSSTKIRMQSDTVEKNSIYQVNGYILGNAVVNNTVSFDDEIGIDGDLTLNNWAVAVNNGKLNIKGNVYIKDMGANIINNANFSTDGFMRTDISGDGWYNVITNNGVMSIKKDLLLNIYNAYKIYISNSNNGIIEIGGNYYNRRVGNTIGGTIVFNGDSLQTIENLSATNITVTNSNGVKYLSNIDICGTFKLNGNPLYNNGYATYLYSGFKLCSDSNYGDLRLTTQQEIYGNIYGNVTINGVKITIPTDRKIEIVGDLTVGDRAVLENNGDLETTGNVYVKDWSANVVNNGNLYIDGFMRTDISQDGYYNVITNTGELCIKKDLSVNIYNAYKIYVSNSNNGIIKIGGNCYMRKSTSINGTLIFNGTDLQTVTNITAPTIILENTSSGGVTFSTAISPSTLFNHNGNEFTLSRGGSFVDYDGDGLKDNVDPYPLDPLNGNNNTDFIVTMANSNLTITGYTGNDKNIVIPDTIDGHKVTNVNCTFDGCDFESVTIGKNVTSWSSSNFNAATKLQNIFVADGNENYSSIDGVLYSNAGKTLQKYPRGRIDSTFVIPETVTSIGASAFYGCSSLVNINIPTSLETINSYAFKNCSSLKNVIIPNSVTAIKEGAFDGCTSLEKAELSYSISSIGSNAFANCPNLTIRCYYRTPAYTYATTNSVPYEIIEVPSTGVQINDITVITGSSSNISYSIEPWYSSDEVSYISSNTDVATITDGVITASKCGRTIITITTDSGKTDTCVLEVTDFNYTLANDNTTVTITGYTGSDKNIVIPDTIGGLPVTYINSSFDGCAFESVTIGKNVSSWSTTNFNSATKLQNIYVADGNENYSSIDGVLYSNAGKTLQKYPRGRIDSTFVIPETVTSIAGNAFSYSSIESIRIPEGIESIGFSAFSSCSNLKTIYYDAIHCTTPSVFFFSLFSSKVENFIIGEKVEYLPGYLLKNATVSEIIIPASVTSIHEKAFYNFGQLTIKAYANSCAKYYAESNGYNFVEITCGNCRCNNWQIVTDSSCTEEGTKIGICDVCGAAIEEAVPTKDHNYVSVITAPSCTSDGYTTHTCSVCGYTYTDSAVTALGHSFTNYVSNGDATCTANGTETAKCDRCDVTDTVTDDNSAKGHTIVIDKAVAPTCTETGLTEGQHCSVCGEVLVTQEVVPMSDHTDADQDGKCDTCGKDMTENCTCICHKGGFMGFIYKIIRIFWKLFGTNKTCSCGQAHY